MMNSRYLQAIAQSVIVAISYGRMDVAVLRVGGGAKRLGIGEIADHRMAAALRHQPRFLIVAHQRGHIVSGAQKCVQHRCADVAGCASEKDPHRGRIS